jgi:hypothetical protein
MQNNHRRFDMDRKKSGKPKDNRGTEVENGPNPGDESDHMDSGELDDLPPCLPPQDEPEDGTQAQAPAPAPALPHAINRDNVLGYAMRLEADLKSAKDIAISMLGAGFATVSRQQQDTAYATLRAIETAGAKAKRLVELVKGV